MNDKDRDLIVQVLHAAGTVGSQGFGYLVRYQIIDGVMGVLTCAAVIIGAVWCLSRLILWQPDTKGDDADMVHFCRATAMLALCITILLCIFGAGSSTVQVWEPEGAAIGALVHHR